MAGNGVGKEGKEWGGDGIGRWEDVGKEEKEEGEELEKKQGG